MRAESHLYAATHGLGASFYLIGGQYDLYVYAKRPIVGPYAPASRSFLVGGNLRRVWPTHDVMSLGSGIYHYPMSAQKKLTRAHTIDLLYANTAGNRSDAA
jgi:hypothetical protein